MRAGQAGRGFFERLPEFVLKVEFDPCVFRQQSNACDSLGGPRDAQANLADDSDRVPMLNGLRHLKLQAYFTAMRRVDNKMNATVSGTRPLAGLVRGHPSKPGLEGAGQLGIVRRERQCHSYRRRFRAYSESGVRFRASWGSVMWELPDCFDEGWSTLRFGLASARSEDSNHARFARKQFAHRLDVW
jgi:hypothetical protein